MHKKVAVWLIAAAALLAGGHAYAYDGLCSGNADPSARIKCLQAAPAFSGWAMAQYAARCPDKSMECYHQVLAKWAYCVPYAQAAGVAYTGTRGFLDLPPAQWDRKVQEIDASLTVGPYGPQTMKPNYTKLIAAEGFAGDALHSNAEQATSYTMNMCLDDRLYQ